jgi:hypothetical protein
MKVVRPSNDDEMVAVFLFAELDSTVHSNVHDGLESVGLTEAQLRNPNLADAEENAKRAALLGMCRGWRQNEYIFKDFPSDVEWSLVTFDQTDVGRSYFGNLKPWDEYTGNTLRVADGATRIRDSDVAPPTAVRADLVRDIAKAIEDGRQIPPVIALTSPGAQWLLMLEGWKRMTAYALFGEPIRFLGILGTASIHSLSDWWLFPPSLRP